MMDLSTILHDFEKYFELVVPAYILPEWVKREIAEEWIKCERAPFATMPALNPPAAPPKPLSAECPCGLMRSQCDYHKGGS